MSESNNDSSNKIIIALLGMLAGAFLVYVILKKDIIPKVIQTPVLSTQLQQNDNQKLLQDYEYQKAIQEIQHHKALQDIKNNQSQYQQQPMLQQTDSSLQQVTAQLQKISSQIELVSQLQQVMNQSQKISSQIEQTTFKLQELQETVSRLRQEDIPHNSAQSQPIQPEQQIYKNNEKWKIARGSDGRIKSLEIIRDVKKNG